MNTPDKYAALEDLIALTEGSLRSEWRKIKDAMPERDAERLWRRLSNSIVELRGIIHRQRLEER